MSLWDMGDTEPEGVDSVESMCGWFDDDYSEPLKFSRTYRGEWKTYLNGNMYLDWGEMVRRFGPVRESTDD